MRQIMVLLGMLTISTTYAFEAFVHPQSESMMEAITPDLLKESFYIETWNFISKLDQGYLLNGRIILKRLGDPSAEATLITPEGEVIYATEEYPWEKVSLEKNNPAFSVGPHRWSGNTQRQKVEIAFPQFSAKLTFHNIAPGWTYRDGTVPFSDKKFIRFYMHNPLAQVEGTLSFQGKEIQVTGIGYGDHSVQNAAPNFADQWYNFHMIQPGFSAHAIIFQPRKKESPQVGMMVLFEKDKLLLETSEINVTHSEIQEDPLSKRHFPLKWTYKGSEGPKTLKVDFQTGKLLIRIDPAGRVPAIAKPILEWLNLRPVLYEFSNQYQIELPDGRLFQGEGLHEWIQMKGD
ncbi:MAG: hypothetical protein HY538_07030 [Deltaproteobacteria bacterium]|nr:hypothetical protein [Deltaproteobacteria bacterium]